MKLMERKQLLRLKGYIIFFKIYFKRIEENADRHVAAYRDRKFYQ